MNCFEIVETKSCNYIESGSWYDTSATKIITNSI